MAVLQMVPGASADLADDPADVGALMILFAHIQEEGQEMAQEEVRNGGTWAGAESCSTILGATGNLVLIGYLLWRLYRNQTHTTIKLCVEVGSTSKTVTLLVMKLPEAPANYHIRTEGSPKVLSVQEKWRPQLVFDRG